MLDHALSLTAKHHLRFSVLNGVTQKTIRAYRLQFTLPPVNQELFLNTFCHGLVRVLSVVAALMLMDTILVGQVKQWRSLNRKHAEEGARCAGGG